MSPNTRGSPRDRPCPHFCPGGLLNTRPALLPELLRLRRNPSAGADDDTSDYNGTADADGGHYNSAGDNGNGGAKASGTRSPRPNTFSAYPYVFATTRRTGASVVP